jgi:hypothetical protein
MKNHKMFAKRRRNVAYLITFLANLKAIADE